MLLKVVLKDFCSVSVCTIQLFNFVYMQMIQSACCEVSLSTWYNLNYLQLLSLKVQMPSTHISV